MRMTVVFREAIVGSIEGSRVPPLTSLMMWAPAFTAARATEARKVSMLMAAFGGALGVVEVDVEVEVGVRREFRCWMAGRTRAVSSSALTMGALGRVDWPPTSMIVAPLDRWVAIVAWRVGRSVGELMPPSEKESGVTLRMDMMWVLRVGSRLEMGSKVGDRGVSVDAGLSGVGRLARWWE